MRLLKRFLDLVEMNDVNNLSSKQVENDEKKKGALPLATLGFAGTNPRPVPTDRLERVVNLLARVVNLLAGANLYRTSITCCQPKRLLLGPEALANRLRGLN